MSVNGGGGRRASRRPSTVAREDAWAKEIEKKFRRIAGADGKISFEEFKAAIEVKEEYFAERYFKFFDRDGSGEIELQEFLKCLQENASQTDIEKMQFLFQIFDSDGDGTVSHDELKIVLNACIAESSITISDEQLEVLVKALLKAADRDNDGVITFEELRVQFEKYPSLIDNLAISPSNWLKLKESGKKKSADRLIHLRKSVINNFKNKKPLVVLMTLYFLANVASFAVSATKYRSSNGFVVIARGCGMALNFNCAFIALSMARRTLTFLRHTRIGPYLPIDDHIEVHKIVGVMIGVYSVIHTVCHLANIGLMASTRGSLLYWEFLLTTRARIGQLGGLAPLTGDILILVLLLMLFCSMPYVRRSGMFELFYWTHTFYLIFWVVLLLHGPIFWMWFIGPGLLLLLEKMYAIGLYCYQSGSSAFFIEQVQLLPSKVIHLVITRPSNLQFKAGDYVFINIPDISRFEWHPFSISSAPEQEGVLWLHIRSLGNWTKRLYDFYDKGEYIQHSSCWAAEDAGLLKRVEKNMTNMKSQPNPRKSNPDPRSIFDHRKVHIDGPFGSAAARMGESSHAVLIAAGIGVTPFASALQSLLIQNRRARKARQDGLTDGQPAATRNDANFRLKKVDFIWVNRQANDFEWFISLLTQLELEESTENEFDHFLDLHLYMTAAKSSDDLKGVGLQMALELVHQEANEDMLTGLRTRTIAGRPNWKQILTDVQEQNHGDVHVYFCGSPTLADVIKDECTNFGFLLSHIF